MKLGNYYTLCTDQKNLQNNSIKVWLALFKDGNNFVNSKNSKTSELHRFKLDLTDKPNLKDTKKHGLSQLEYLLDLKNIKSEYNINKLKILAPTWNDTFDLPHGFYSIADIQDYFESIIKNTKFWLKTCQLRFTQIKSKTKLFSK